MTQPGKSPEPKNSHGRRHSGIPVLVLLAGSLTLSLVLVATAVLWYVMHRPAQAVADATDSQPPAVQTTAAPPATAPPSAQSAPASAPAPPSAATAPPTTTTAPVSAPATAPPASPQQSPASAAKPADSSPATNSPSANRPAESDTNSSASAAATTPQLANEPAAPMSPPQPATSDNSASTDEGPDSSANAASAADKAIPSDEDLQKARADIIEIFGDEARQASRPEQKRAVAEKMLAVVEQAKGERAGQYVLLESAIKLLIAAGDVELTATTVETFCELFAVDAWQRRTAAMTGLADATLTPHQREELVSHLLEGMQTALAEEQFEAADAYSLLAVKAGSRLKDIDLRKRVVQRRNEIQQLVKQAGEIEKARSVLADSPDDPAANLAVGKFLCFALEDWKAGIPHLAKSGDTDLAAAAELDRKATADPQQSLAAANAWFEWAESARDTGATTAVRRRAKNWYERARQSASGLEQALVEKRLESLKDVEPAATTSATATSAAPTSAVATADGPSRRPTKRGGKPKAFDGLVGRIVINNRDAGVLLRYQPGHLITQEEFSDMLSQINAGEQEGKVIEFLGVITMATDGSVQVRHVGGSASGGVHRLMVDGRPVSEVGDDRTKDTRSEFALSKGDHAIRWQLTGGELGTAQLVFQLTKPDPPNEGVLRIHVPKEIMAGVQRLGAAKEFQFGTDPEQ